MPDLIQSAVDVLSEALAADREALTALLWLTIPINRALAEHPDIPCRVSNELGGAVCAISPLGLVSGILQRATGRKVAAKVEPDADGILRIVGFCEYREYVAPPAAEMPSKSAPDPAEGGAGTQYTSGHRLRNSVENGDYGGGGTASPGIIHDDRKSSENAVLSTISTQSAELT